MRTSRECLGKFGDALGKEVWEAINSVFDVLPLAAVIDDQVWTYREPFLDRSLSRAQILCLHGGIPSPASCPGDFVSTVNKIPVPLSDPDLESSLAWEIMWNDPFSVDPNAATQIPSGGFFNNTRRSTGNYFTSEALMAFLEKNNLTHVIRAHEVQQVGFKVCSLTSRILHVIVHRLKSIGTVEWTSTHGLLLVALLWWYQRGSNGSR